MKQKILKFLIVTACLFFIYKYFKDNLNIYNIVINANYSKLSFIIFVVSIIIFLYARLLLLILTKLCGIKISNQKWYLIYFNSQFLNAIPLFGIFYRAIQLKKFNLNYDKYFGIYIILTWFFIFLSLFLFSVETYLVFPDIKFLKVNLHVIFLMLSLFFFIIPILILIIIKKILIKINYKSNYIISRLEKLIDLFLLSISNKVFLKHFIFILF